MQGAAELAVPARGPVLAPGAGQDAQELLAGFSLPGELKEEDEEEEKLTPARPGGGGLVGGRVLSSEAFLADRAAVVLLQPGHDAAVVEEVLSGQLPQALTQPVVVLAHGALQPGAYMLLGHGGGGEGLDFLLVCRRGARVFKLIEVQELPQP